MNEAEKFLFQHLEAAKQHSQQSILRIEELAPEICAELYINTIYLLMAIQAIHEKHWLLTHNLNQHELAFQDFMKIAESRELSCLRFLLPLLTQSTTLEQENIRVSTANLATAIRNSVNQMSDRDYRKFLDQAVRSMFCYWLFEEHLLPNREIADQKLQLRLSQLDSRAEWTQKRPLPAEELLPALIYRAFDSMDEIFNFDFNEDQSLCASENPSERLYQGGGAGVQTSYASILAALRALDLPPEAHLIDLGSGYGRMGLIAGLWRSNLKFTGYEFVGHRVKISNRCALRAILNDRVQFIEQDLSDPNFQIPLADAYYMYDPFSPKTYQRVIDQLNQLSHKHPITVVTKADAGTWFQKMIQGGHWQKPETCDEGMLLLFRSTEPA